MTVDVRFLRGQGIHILSVGAGWVFGFWVFLFCTEVFFCGCFFPGWGFLCLLVRVGVVFLLGI